jgi:hypothetical protein
MTREAFINSGVAYHHGAIQAGQPLDGFEVIELGGLADVDLNAYDLLVVPRSSDGDALRARRHQFARFLDRGGVLVAFGELWADWFPGCHWEEECAEDILAPVITAEHPIVAGFEATDLHWHPARERWCCHGHLVAPSRAEVIVRNQRGDAWLYVDRTTTNGVIVASTNLDPDTHSFHGNATARRFFDQLLAWARGEAARASQRRAMAPPKIAGLYSGVHFQRRFYADPEFSGSFVVLPVWELAATDLSAYAALWIPRESNQLVLVEQREKLVGHLRAGGTIVGFDEVNQPWLPAGHWEHRPVNLDAIRVSNHPIVAGLTPADARWHSHGAYDPPAGAETLIDDGGDGVMLFLDERTFPGRLLAGTIDPDCHAGFGAEVTRPLLRRLVTWALAAQPVVTAG